MIMVVVVFRLSQLVLQNFSAEFSLTDITQVSLVSEGNPGCTVLLGMMLVGGGGDGRFHHADDSNDDRGSDDGGEHLQRV